MRFLTIFQVCLLLLSGAMLCGCGGESGKGGGGGAATSSGDDGAAESVKKISAAKLPKLSDYQPPLEKGKVEVAAPNGWSALPRSEKFLIRFFHEDKTKLPRIEVTSAENPLDDMGDVTPENVAEFAKAMRPVTTKGGRKVLEPCIPLLLEGSGWARHVRLAKSSGGMVQIQSLQTIRGGRLYTVDLLVEGEEAEEMKKYKDYGYSVAAGMKFEGGGGATDFKVPAAEAPASTPADPNAEQNP